MKKLKLCSISLSSEIIETYWNVNLYEVRKGDKRNMEIIETYWNVNLCRISFFNSCISEIIETYWNVNSCMQPAQTWINPK